jgi:Asp-tRNA(Asn)/Glu-tRNA(Gln) amidotransferase A subunit family amidase
VNELYKLSAVQAAKLIADGSISVEELAKSCLARVEMREPNIGAWQYLNPAQVLERARELDKVPRDSRKSSPIYGVPIGIKDICDTADMPTCYGSREKTNYRPMADAACVALARSAGGLVFGKTTSTEFAGRYACSTSNPHDLSRSPGGSSSGSAAAVADFMIPLAIGTQTVGSIIRPAAYCGVVGYKPTFGHFSIQGVHHGAPTFDTLGCMARDIDDIVLLRRVLLGFEKVDVGQGAKRVPRVAFCRTPKWQDADEATRTQLEHAAKELAKAGADVVELSLPEGFNAIYKLNARITAVEYARSVAHEINQAPENLSSPLTEKIEEARQGSAGDYIAALKEIESLRHQIDDVLRGFDFVLAPSALGEAPVGRADTGLATFNVIWHALSLPCVTLPVFRGPANMPIGVQLVANRHMDADLLEMSKWVQSVLAPSGLTSQQI